ncbi:hypothetical protein LCGC14_1639570 [marine sediment metagenome]|uniref:Uncharacterized protein n=1 Tax=marine sediment metagenome TaxID=412755 RepID=A0A0F9HZZ7_9ZZZZ
MGGLYVFTEGRKLKNITKAIYKPALWRYMQIILPHS